MSPDIYLKLAKEALADVRVVNVLAAVIEENMTAYMKKEHGGERVYVPKTLGTAERDRRDEAIRRDFSGNNIQALHRQHGLSRRQIRRVVAKKPLPCEK